MLRVDAIAAAETFVSWVEVYAAAGLLIAAAFLLFGVGRVSEEAHGNWLFRLVILPGVVVLWPLVLWRWIRLERRGGVP